MRGSSSVGLLLGPALAGALGLRTTQVASADISLAGDEPSSYLNFRLHVFESEDACGPANVTIANEPLPEGGRGSVSLGNGLEALGRWTTSCDGFEQRLVLSLDSVPVKGFDGAQFTITFQQTAPVHISEIAHLESNDESDEVPAGSIRQAIGEELNEDVDQLESLRDMEIDLIHQIHLKQEWLVWMEATERAFLEAVQGDDDAPKCKGLWCAVKGIFDRLTGLGHPRRGRWPHKGCGNHSHGNHTHGNHTFPHPPPWWRHRHGNHTHGNHTHGNHTFPLPPWWRHRHGNHTHGNHTHPPFHRRPPFFCRPHHKHPHKPPHGKPPHGKPPHSGPPHGGPPHGGPPHGGPPHDRPPFFKPPAGFPHNPSQLPIQRAVPHGPAVATYTPAGLHGVFLAAKPFFKVGISVAFFSLLVIALHARCRARRAGVSWAERREARRRACRAKRAALRRRWIAFLDQLRPEESSEDCLEKMGMLEEAALDEKKGLCQEKTEEKEMENDDLEGMTMSEELASFRDAATMVGEMVAAEECRTRRE